MKYLLDTSALLAHYRREPGAHQVQALFEEEESEVLIASLSVTEFARRIEDLGSTKVETQRALDGYGQAVSEVVPIDEAVARKALEAIRGARARIPLADALIAATAAAQGACLVHRNRHLRALATSFVKQLELPEKD